MKVKELIEALQDMNPDAIVVMAKDAGGNNWCPAVSIDEGHYEQQKPWTGLYLTDNELGDDEFAQPNGPTIAAVCIWPLN